MFRGEMSKSHEIAEKLARQAASLEDESLMVEAHRALGSSLINLGDFATALEHFERASALYKQSDQDAYFLIHGNDAKVMSLCFAARVLWCLGYPDGSLRKIQEAVAQNLLQSKFQNRKSKIPILVPNLLQSKFDHMSRSDRLWSPELATSRFSLSGSMGT